MHFRPLFSSCFLLLVFCGLLLACGETRTPAQPDEARESEVEARVASSLSGRITAPDLKAKPLPGDPCAVGGDPQDSWQVGAEGGLADVVVTLSRPAGVREAATEKHRPTAASPPRATLRVEGCRFVPRVQVVEQSTVLRVSHEDPGLHTFHLYFQEDEGAFRSVQNLAVAPGAPPLEWPLAISGLYRVRSDQVPWMEAWIQVKDGQLVAQTDAEGRFEFEDLVPGDWEATLWHEGLGKVRSFVTVPQDGPASLFMVFPETEVAPPSAQKAGDP